MELRPYEIERDGSTTGWHLIWLNERVMAFQIKADGPKYMLIVTNNGETHELWQKQWYWIARNAPKPTKQSLFNGEYTPAPKGNEGEAMRKLAASSPANRRKREQPEQADEPNRLTAKQMDDYLFRGITPESAQDSEIPSAPVEDIANATYAENDPQNASDGETVRTNFFDIVEQPVDTDRFTG